MEENRISDQTTASKQTVSIYNTTLVRWWGSLKKMLYLGYGVSSHYVENQMVSRCFA